jgi:hypothetical protein
MQLEIPHECLLQQKLAQLLTQGRAVDLHHPVNICDAFHLYTDHTHVVACMILRHPDKAAKIAFGRVPVHRLSDVRVATPERSC